MASNLANQWSESWALGPMARIASCIFKIYNKRHGSRHLARKLLNIRTQTDAHQKVSMDALKISQTYDMRA